MTKRLSGWVSALVLGSALSAAAQTPVANPTRIEFNASVEHNVLTPVTQAPVLTRYDALYYLASSCTLGATKDQCPTTTPAFTINLGKPTAANGGLIAVTDVFQGLVLNQVYKAVIVAVGPGGTRSALASNPFGNEQVSAPSPATSVVIK